MPGREKGLWEGEDDMPEPDPGMGRANGDERKVMPTTFRVRDKNPKYRTHYIAPGILICDANIGDYDIRIRVFIDEKNNFILECRYSEKNGNKDYLYFVDGYVPTLNPNSGIGPTARQVITDIGGVERQIQRCYDFFKKLIANKDRHEAIRLQKASELSLLGERLGK